MVYTKTQYVDGVTPLNARNFNKNEGALEQVSKDIDLLSSAISQVDGELDNKSNLNHTHSEYATTSSLNNKVDKVDGKGLSTNDFTTVEKNKLAGLENADVDKVYVDEQDTVLDNKITVLSSELETIQNDSLSGKSFRYLTQAEYNALSDDDKNNDNVVWCITDSDIPTGGNSELFSPDGSKWILKISNDGTLTTEKVFVQAQSVTLNKKSHTLKVEETTQLVATVLPAGSNQSVVWSSSNENVATVSNGLVVGVGGGNCNIVATSTDGGFKATCNIIVNAPIVFTNYAYNTDTYNNPTTSTHPNKTSYYVNYNTTKSVSGGVCTITKTVDSSTNCYFLAKVNLGDNNKYYIRCAVKTTAVGVVAGKQLSEVAIPGDGNWNLVSYVHNDTSQNSWNLSVQMPTSNIGDSLEVKEIMRINLTEIFGAGNEPSKEVCDSTFTTYKTGLIG